MLTSTSKKLLVLLFFAPLLAWANPPVIWNGTNAKFLNSGSVIIPGLSTGSVPFIGASGLVSQDNADFFWDNTNKRLGINAAGAPVSAIDVESGSLLFNGTTGSMPASGAGTRLEWTPSLGSFRAGVVNSTQWDSGNTGNWSVAMGANTKASGSASFSVGNANTASGNFSNSWGSNSTAFGTNSAALGDHVTADAFDQVTVGIYNNPTGTENPTTYVSTDPLFVVGNGTGSGAKGNALVILKNGTTTFSGPVSASNLSGTNSGDVTLGAVGSSPSASGASLAGQVLTLQPFDGTHPGVVTASGGGTSNFLRADGTWAAAGGGSGTVTSVGVSVPSFLTVSNSPVTSSGTIAIGLSTTSALPVANGGTGLLSDTAYALFAGGTTSTAAHQQVSGVGTSGNSLISAGAGALPAWSTVALGSTTAVSGTLPVSNGGNGVPSLTAYSLIAGGTTSTAAVQQIAAGSTTGQVLTYNGSSSLPTWSSLSGNYIASWSGYQTVSGGCAVTTATLQDPSTCTGIAVTEQTNTNMGTVTTAGSSLPGLTLTFPITGTYLIQANVTAKTSVSNSDNSIQMTDGSTIFSQPVGSSNGGSGNLGGMFVSGLYKATGGSAVTIKLQIATDAGTFSIANALNGKAIAWNIQLVSGGSNVSSAGTSGYHMEFANITCSGASAVNFQSGAWTIGNIASGKCTVTIPSGVFSSANYSCGHLDTGTSVTAIDGIRINNKATTSFDIYGSTISSGSSTIAAATSFTTDIMCMGPR